MRLQTAASLRKVHADPHAPGTSARRVHGHQMFASLLLVPWRLPLMQRWLLLRRRPLARQQRLLLWRKLLIRRLLLLMVRRLPVIWQRRLLLLLLWRRLLMRLLLLWLPLMQQWQPLWWRLPTW